MRRLLSEIGHRDNWICKLCGTVVNKRDPRGPYAPTLDHIVPRSKGGPFIWDNLQLAHYKCNQAKGNSHQFEIGGKCPRYPKKRAFADYDQAEVAANHIFVTRGSQMAVYWCHWCNYWHHRAVVK